MMKVKSKAKVYKFLPMEISISENTNQEVPKGMESTIGKMDPTIEVNFYQECDMVEVSGT